MSKSPTRKAEKIVLKFVNKQPKGKPFRLTKVHRKYRDVLPTTFAAWNLRQRGEFRRARGRGFFVR